MVPWGTEVRRPVRGRVGRAPLGFVHLCPESTHWHMAGSVELEAPIDEAPGLSPGLGAPAPAPPPSSLCAPRLATSCPYTSRPHPLPALATVIVNRDLSNVSGVTVQETVVFVVVVLI